MIKQIIPNQCLKKWNTELNAEPSNVFVKNGTPSHQTTLLFIKNGKNTFAVQKTNNEENKATFPTVARRGFKSACMR